MNTKRLPTKTKKMSTTYGRNRLMMPTKTVLRSPMSKSEQPVKTAILKWLTSLMSKRLNIRMR